jgi:MoaA/NifB/PqqE/SkfB family radical SAM enzyme
LKCFAVSLAHGIRKDQVLKSYREANMNFTPANISALIQTRPGIWQIGNLLHYFFGRRKEVLKYQPVYLFLAITDRCIMKCRMCQGHSDIMSNYNGKHPPLPDMSLDMFKRIVDHYKKAINISLVGSGEPLLNNEFANMVRYAKQIRRTRVTTLSNGLMLENKVNDVLSSGLDAISISIKGFSREDFLRLTGAETDLFDTIIINVTRLAAMREKSHSRLQIYGSFILDKQNYRYIGNMIELARKIKLDMVKFDTFLPYPYCGYTVEERCITAGDSEIIRFLENVDYQKYDMAIRAPLVLDLNNAQRRICRIPFSSLRVDSAGNIGACNIKLLNLGNNGKFYDVDAWNNEYFRSIRRMFLEMRPAFIPEACLTCYEYAGTAVT